ncbi:MAG: sigma-70 family RNA polymerase sigma factor [Nanoarchaeota archaeon]|mgnify:CR=1 FL=1
MVAPPFAYTPVNKKYYVGWETLNQLGAEYHDLVRQGYGIKEKNKHPRQQQIEREMVEGLQGYVWKIARSMIGHRGSSISTEHGEKNFSVRGTKIPLEDLVNEGSIGILKALLHYDPDKSSVSTYFGIYITVNIYKAGMEGYGLFRLPENIRQTIKNMCDGDKIKTVTKIKELTGSKEPLSEEHALAFYNSVVEPSTDIDGLSLKDPKSNKIANIKELELSKEDFEEESTGRDSSIDLENLLPCLKPREQDILQRRSNDETLQSIGDSYHISRERVRQIEVVAMKKLREKNKKENSMNSL